MLLLFMYVCGMGGFAGCGIIKLRDYPNAGLFKCGIFETRDQIQHCLNQRWSRGHKARGQGQGHKKNPRPRPRTAFPRTDTLEAKDRNARGQGPRTQAQVFSKKKKKKVFTKIVLAISKKKRSSQKFFKRSPQKTFNNSKSSAVLEPRTGQFLRT